MAAWKSRRREEGQVFPVLLVLFTALLAGGFMLLQVGRGAAMRAEGVTAADAAALAGAQNIRDQLEGLIMTGGFADPGLVDLGEAESAAASYAEKNGGRLVDFDTIGYDVVVTVETQDALEGESARDLDVEGLRANATARAHIEATWHVGPHPGLALGNGGLTGREIKQLEEQTGMELHPRSSLRVNGDNCATDNADVVHLHPAMKAAIVRAEAEIGPLAITEGYRTYECQANVPAANPGGMKAPPGRSMHNLGMAIDVSPSGPLAAATAADPRIGLCQPFPSGDPVHFALAQSVECGGATGPLGPGGAFGRGGIGSFVTYEVYLVDED